MNDIFYITAWSKDDPKGGVYACKLTENSLEKLAFSPLKMAGYTAFSADGCRLYATGAVKDEEGIAAFAVKEDKTLEFLNFVPSRGVSTCHLCCAPGGRYLYSANYSSGNFSEFTLSPDGSMEELTQVVKHDGSGPVADRQECAHPHFVSITPDGRFLAVTDLGCDKIVCYPFDPECGIDSSSPVESIMPSGCGPRHIHFAENGIAYLVTELGNTVLSMKYADGSFKVLNEISLLPELCSCDTKASAIRMSADGRFLVATNRGFDSLVVIEVDGKGGMKLNQTTLSGAVSPRDVNFLPDGRHFAAANEFSDVIYFFDFDPEKGTLTPNGLKLEYPRPICIAWSGK
jgi:6-phosphogluconolactonase